MEQIRGIRLPFRIAPHDADVATLSGNDLRQVRLGTALSTRASTPGEVGELAWDPERGSRLDQLRNAAASASIADLAAVYTERAILDALPDEELRGIDVRVDDRTLTIHVEAKRISDTTQAPRTVTTTTEITR